MNTKTRMSIREVTRRYKTIPIPEEDKERKVLNQYVCEKGHVLPTIDVDPGTTPFITKCPCGSPAKSSFYENLDSRKLKPIFQWYRPALHEVLKKYRKNYEILEHIFAGGLLRKSYKE